MTIGYIYYIGFPVFCQYGAREKQNFPPPEQLFQGAVQQVINYSAWRDLKVSVIIFNKENQSFQSILAKIKKWADINTVSYTQPQANIWKCKYHRQDMNVDIQLTILAFDLYVDKSQFKDSR